MYTHTEHCGCRHGCPTWARITEWECGCVQVQLYDEQTAGPDCTRFTDRRRWCDRPGAPPHRDIVEAPRPRPPEPRRREAPRTFGGGGGGGGGAGDGFGLIGALITLVIVLIPFVPIIMLGSTIKMLIGGGVGTLVGWGVGGAAVVALFKFRHFRAFYFFAYAGLVEASIFLKFLIGGSGLMGAILSVALGALLFRGCFELWRWGAEPGIRTEPWTVSVVGAVGCICFAFLLNLVAPDAGFWLRRVLF